MIGLPRPFAAAAMGAVGIVALAAGVVLMTRSPDGSGTTSSNGPTTDVRLPAATSTPAAAPTPPPPPAPAELYATHCHGCHGDGGKGDGPLAASLPVPPANIVEHLDHHSEDELVMILLRGLPPAMPPAAMSDADARRLAIWLETLPPN